MAIESSKRIKASREEREEQEQAVALALEDMPDQYLACRGMRHAWAVMNDFYIMAGDIGARFLRRDLTCTRDCGTIRHDTWLLGRSRNGVPTITQKLPAHYAYPADYQLHGVPRGVKSSTLVFQEELRRYVSTHEIER